MATCCARRLLFGEPLELTLVGHIRPELSFTSLDKLITAIHADIESSTRPRTSPRCAKARRAPRARRARRRPASRPSPPPRLRSGAPRRRSSSADASDGAPDTHSRPLLPHASVRTAKRPLLKAPRGLAVVLRSARWVRAVLSFVPLVVRSSFAVRFGFGRPEFPAFHAGCSEWGFCCCFWKEILARHFAISDPGGWWRMADPPEEKNIRYGSGKRGGAKNAPHHTERPTSKMGNDSGLRQQGGNRQKKIHPEYTPGRSRTLVSP